MSKKVLLSFLMVCIVMTMFAFVPASAASTDDGLVYNIVDDEVIITGCYTSYWSDEFSIKIPGKIDHCPVVAIADSAFSNRENLVGISMPNSVRYIGDRAFYNCKSLKNIEIPAGVTYIGVKAFDECTGLKSVGIKNIEAWCSIEFGQEEVYDEEKGMQMGNGEFANPLKYGGKLFVGGKEMVDLVIPDGVTAINDYAFYGCSSIKTLVIPDGVETIGKYAFARCTSLEIVSFPEDSISSMGDHAFWGCSKLKEFELPESLTEKGSYSEGSSVETTGIDKALIYNIDNGKVTITGCEKSSTGVKIPSKIENYPVVAIGDKAFADCSRLSSAVIPDTVVSIGNEAFRDCGNLRNIVIPDSVTSVGEYAFHGCAKLETADMSDNVSSISRYAFGGCNALKKVDIPKSVTSIGGYAFYECKSLGSLTLGDAVTSIGDYAFAYCNNLSAINIPSSVTTMGNAVFYDCSKLKSISVPKTVTTMGNSIFRGCKSLENVSLHARISQIGPDFFAYCNNMKTITLPKTLNYVTEDAFYDCARLTNVSFEGTKSAWENIVIEYGNEDLENAHIIFSDGSFSGSDEISVRVDGIRLIFDQPPVAESGRTLVPVRAIFEALGATVEWDGDTQTVTSRRDSDVVSLKLGSKRMYVNNTEKTLDVPAKALNGRTLVPVRAISEAFGCDVIWDGNTRTVFITQ